MSGLMKSFGSLTGALMNGRDPKLPPLPDNLGLPEKSNVPTYREKTGMMVDDKRYVAELQKANAYNQALVNLLNEQPHLSGTERSQFYKYYGDEMSNTRNPEFNSLRKKHGGVIDFTGQLSQLTPEQFKAQQQQQAAPAQMPTPAPAPAPAPQTVGPTPKPTVVQPPPTPTVATPAGNIAGKTATVGVMGTDAGGRGSGRKRGRVATLLTGLGGAAEQFGA